MAKTSRTRRTWLNLCFLIICAGLVAFLLLAPEETTSPLPRDEIHQQFHQIQSKKEAEKGCVGCHETGGEAPLPDTHPDPYRCLFCHKR
jgi:cytochrome c553